VEKSVNDEQSIRQFLSGMYGAKGSNGEVTFVPEKGILVENLPKIGESKILNGKVRDDLFCWNACRVRDRRERRVQDCRERQMCYLLRGCYGAVTPLDRGIATSDISCMRRERVPKDRLGSTSRSSRVRHTSRSIHCIALFQKDSLRICQQAMVY